MNRWIRRLIWLACLAPGLAFSSPWTLPSGQLAANVAYTYQTAERQYNIDGSLEPYPLTGSQVARDATLSLRYGLADGVEIEGGLAYKSVSYSAELLCLDGTQPATSPDDYHCPGAADQPKTYGGLQVIDVNAGVQGVGDVYGLFKIRLVQQPLLLTIAPYVKVPTGYRPPGALFASPTDDVALGDGQVDLGGFLYLGRVIAPWRTFLRLDLGYLHRFGAPGDQLVGRFRVGYQVHPALVLAAGVQLEQTVTPGEAIGTQGIRINADGSLDLQTVVSERNAYTVDGAAIFRLKDRTEVIVSAFKVVGGRYVAESRGFSVGLIQHFF